MKHCKDCDHFRIVRGELYTFQMCHNPKTVDPVGNIRACAIARTAGPCGESGALWEPIKPYRRPTFWQRLFKSYDDNGRLLGAG